MKYQGLNLSNDAANTAEAVIAENVDFLDLTLHGKIAHLKKTGTQMSTPVQRAAWYGSLVLAVGAGKLYTVDMASGTVTEKKTAAQTGLSTTLPVSINVDGMPEYAILCDGVAAPKTWDGTNIRDMGPPAKPAAAPVAVVATPSSVSGSVLVNHASYSSACKQMAQSFRWTGNDSYLTLVEFNDITTAATSLGCTLTIYESTSPFSTDPTAGSPVASKAFSTAANDQWTSNTFTVAEAVKLTNGNYYSAVLTFGETVPTLGLGTVYSYSGPISSAVPYTQVGSGAWVVQAGYTDFRVVGIGRGLNATYSYAYSYKISVRGLESDMSPAASVSPANQSVNIPVLASADATVDKIRIYRIGGSHSTYMLVKELANAGATWNDYATDGTLTEAAVNIGNAAPPVGLKEILFLPDAGCLIGYKADGILYCSKQNGFPAEVEIWPGYEWPIGSDANPIMGICVNQASVVAIRKNGAVKISGSSPDNLFFAELKDVQGTSSARSIAPGINGGFLLGSEAVYAVEYLAQPLKLSELRNKILANYQNGGEVGFYWNKQYFLASATAAEVLVLDVRIQGEMIPTTLPLTVKCFFTNGQHLYFADDLGDIYQYEGGAARGNWDWKSVVQNLNAPDSKKNAEKVVFDFIGNITVTPYLDGVAQNTIALSSATRKRQEQAFTLFSAYRYQFRFQGTNASAELFGFDIKTPKALVTG